jgi:hypothetical protein
MTDNAQNNSDINKIDQEKVIKKTKTGLILKIVIFLIILFFGYILYGSIKQKNFIFNSEKSIKNSDNNNSSDNSEILTLSDEYKDQNSEAIDSLNLAELKEKGDEFIYQTLIKNQLQIEEINEKIRQLKNDFNKYKSQEKIAKITTSYISLREKIYAGSDYSEELKNFEVSVIFDDNLKNKSDRLRKNLASFLNDEKINENFAKIIPNLITKKYQNLGNDLWSKIKYNLSKIIVIRKIDNEDVSTIDGAVLKIENLLRNKKYQEALDNLLLLDQSYHEIIKDFLDLLSVSIEVRKIDQDILNYIKNLV